MSTSGVSTKLFWLRECGEFWGFRPPWRREPSKLATSLTRTFSRRRTWTTPRVLREGSCGGVTLFLKAQDGESVPGNLWMLGPVGGSLELRGSRFMIRLSSRADGRWLTSNCRGIRGTSRSSEPPCGKMTLSTCWKYLAWPPRPRWVMLALL